MSCGCGYGLTWTLEWLQIQLRFVLYAVPMLNIVAAVELVRIYENREKDNMKVLRLKSCELEPHCWFHTADGFLPSGYACCTLLFGGCRRFGAGRRCC